MSSSISSFKNELKVFLVVAVIIGGLDLFQRYEFAHRQRDSEAKLLRSFPVKADELAAQSGTRMILLGNSLAQNGYDMPLMKAALHSAGNDHLHVEKFSQSGSSPIEWYHNFKRIFVRRGKTPDVIVINMSPGGMGDGLPPGYRIGWLANETDWQDVPEVLFEDLRDFEIGAQYLQARLSMLCADRWDLRIAVLYQLDRNLWAGMTWVNTAQLAAKNAAVIQPPPLTYSLLTRMLKLASDTHTQVLLVAMPARETYPIDPDLAGILKEYNATFLDCRYIPGLTTSCFEDGWHLNPQGAKIFTAFMAGRFPAAVKTKIAR